MSSALTPSSPLLSLTEPRVALIAAIAAFSSSFSAAASMMTPSPLNLVPAKIATLSAVSERLMTSPSLPRFWRISLAEDASLRPVSVSALKSEMEMEDAPSRSLSALDNADTAHSAVFTTSFTRIFPSPSVSMQARLAWSISRPCTGQESTVHIVGSSSLKWAMSSPLLILTLEDPPILENSHLYFDLSAIMYCISIIYRTI